VKRAVVRVMSCFSWLGGIEGVPQTAAGASGCWNGAVGESA